MLWRCQRSADAAQGNYLGHWLLIKELLAAQQRRREALAQSTLRRRFRGTGRSTADDRYLPPSLLRQHFSKLSECSFPSRIVTSNKAAARERVEHTARKQIVILVHWQCDLRTRAVIKLSVAAILLPRI